MALPMPLPTPARPTSGIRTPLFLLGVGLALLAFVAMFAFGILFANKGLQKQVPVVVAADDIQAREPISASMLTVTDLPQSAVPPHAFVNVADLTGYSSLVNIYKGQALTANLVAMSPDQIDLGTTSYLPIPMGWVAMALPASELQSIGGYVSPGDYINVIATANSELFFSKPSRMLTRTVFTYLRVIRVGQPSAAPKAGATQGVVASITVLMTQCDAQYMEWLLTNVTLKYVLISFHDYTPAAVGPDPACPTSDVKPPVVGPAAVNARWNFTQD